jgi:hypothetical protein
MENDNAIFKGWRCFEVNIIKSDYLSLNYT